MRPRKISCSASIQNQPHTFIFGPSPSYKACCFSVIVSINVFFITPLHFSILNHGLSIMKQTLNCGVLILTALGTVCFKIWYTAVSWLCCCIGWGGFQFLRSSFLSLSWWVRGLPIFVRFSSEFFGFAFFFLPRETRWRKSKLQWLKVSSFTHIKHRSFPAHRIPG